jgi:Methyltransferase domain
MLKIDIGCGAAKRPGFIGVDVMGEPDVLCDISSERLPFEDLSADHIFSAHCLEHIAHSSLYHVFKEITRIAANDALIEIWHPHASHSDAFVLGHVNCLSEALYAGLRQYWSDYLGAQWILQEIRYSIEPHVLEDIKNARMGIDFAVCYLREIIKEIGIFARIDRTGSTKAENYSRFVCQCYDREHTITQLSDGPRLTAVTHQSHRPPTS